MGTYLSMPVTEKGRETGECLDHVVPVRWGMVDMQGWRKSMEDAHVAATDVTIDDKPAHVFAVFDGHGGAEVARFCQLYFVSVLQQQQQNTDTVGDALVECFHALDRMIADRQRQSEFAGLRTTKPRPGECVTAEHIPPKQPALEAADDGPPEPAPTPPTTPLPDSNLTCGNSEAGTIAVDFTMPQALNEPLQITHHELEYEEDETDKKDDDSHDVVGKEEAAALDQDLMNDDDYEMHAVDTQNDNSSNSNSNGGGGGGKVSIMFQRLLNMSSSAATGDGGSPQRDVRRPSIVQNGRLVCNLPDHPVHAGATAIVAVIVNQTLYVANAGDSRAVLCRNGLAHALSVDHKPLEHGERSRIQNAGGFVNQFGRVNGNLNLSRSIGDLKYKQVPGLETKDQMITAQPDIVQVELEPHDEFLILGCDGIWDCLTNEKAVEYVRSRLDSKAPVEIGIEMLDEILSVDPRITQGIGGDNMTLLVVDLKPQTRFYDCNAESDPPIETDDPSKL